MEDKEVGGKEADDEEMRGNGTRGAWSVLRQEGRGRGHTPEPRVSLTILRRSAHHSPGQQPGSHDNSLLGHMTIPSPRWVT